MAKHIPKRPYLHRCDCGRIAHYKLRVPILRPDLETRIHAVLHLCEACFMLELHIRSLDGRKPPKARRVG